MRSGAFVARSGVDGLYAASEGKKRHSGGMQNGAACPQIFPTAVGIKAPSLQETNVGNSPVKTKRRAALPPPDAKAIPFPNAPRKRPA